MRPQNAPTVHQSVWHKNDVAQIGRALIRRAPSPEYADGVADLCMAIGAPIDPPVTVTVVERVEVTPLISTGASR